MTKIKPTTCLFGAIAGDMIGSRHEWKACTDPQFALFSKSSKFTDDSVLTIAIADAILNQRGYVEVIVEYARKYPKAGYGSFFRRWIANDGVEPYNSFGNGSAMRVSATGWAFNSADEVLREAQRSAEGTHNHPEGIKGAQSIALAIYMARTGVEKDEIRSEIEARFGYDLNHTLEEIGPTYKWDSTCPGSVPESIVAFLESTDYESAVRNAILLGGDADTMAAIAGSIAEAYYGGVPDEIVVEVRNRLKPELLDVVEEFNKHFLAG
ncbi:MAG: ADP-ribosylglycohydrolase family protein [Anaerolineales bacterium]|nr:ADP-ribosylglycohydrolase family protein [Anaerolineales bacterium]